MRSPQKPKRSPKLMVTGLGDEEDMNGADASPEGEVGKDGGRESVAAMDMSSEEGQRSGLTLSQQNSERIAFSFLVWSLMMMLVALDTLRSCCFVTCRARTAGVDSENKENKDGEQDSSPPASSAKKKKKKKSKK